MLKLVIIGNLGADAELRNANGAQFLSFRVAHSDRWTDRNSGEVTTIQRGFHVLLMEMGETYAPT